MPRLRRNCPDGVPEHVVNRGNHREQIFRSDSDYLGFLAAMADGAEKTVVRLLAFCLMPNHWHLVLWPFRGDELSTYMQIVMNSHLQDILPRHGTAGLGHMYQGRFRNHPILNETHFLNVCRYVEANAFTAGLTSRAEDWEWCSLARSGPAPDINLLSPWPVPKPRDWLEQVNRPRPACPLPKPWLAPDLPDTSRRYAAAVHGRWWQPELRA
jgi:putative transposase